MVCFHNQQIFKVVFTLGLWMKHASGVLSKLNIGENFAKIEFDEIWTWEILIATNFSFLVIHLFFLQESAEPADPDCYWGGQDKGEELGPEEFKDLCSYLWTTPLSSSFEVI